MMGIDGTWRRECMMEDISETGAKLTVEGSVEGLHLKEFFLLLSSTGLAYRRCELAWVNGDQIGVNFLKPGDKRKKGGQAPDNRPTPERCHVPPSYGRHVAATMASSSLRSANRRDMIATRPQPFEKLPKMSVKPTKAMVLAAGLGVRMRP